MPYLGFCGIVLRIKPGIFSRRLRGKRIDIRVDLTKKRARRGANHIGYPATIVFHEDGFSIVVRNGEDTATLEFTTESWKEIDKEIGRNPFWKSADLAAVDSTNIAKEPMPASVPVTLAPHQPDTNRLSQVVSRARSSLTGQPASYAASPLKG